MPHVDSSFRRSREDVVLLSTVFDAVDLIYTNGLHLESVYLTTLIHYAHCSGFCLISRRSHLVKQESITLEARSLCHELSFFA